MRIHSGSFFFLACLTGTMISRVCEGSEEIRAKDVRAFLYDVDLEFLFLDELSSLSRPSRISVDTEKWDLVVGDHARSSPTLGLRSAKFGLDWRVGNKIAVELVLRPDAASCLQCREVDTRAGRVVEQAPSIHFIDEYRFIYRPSFSSIQIGVQREVLENYRVVADALDFGLRVRGPEKSMSVGFHVPNLMEFNQGRDGAGMGVMVAALSGRDERHDSRYQENGGAGDSPAKKDPYWGGAASATWILVGDTQIGVGAAAIEERDEGIKVRNQWYQAGIKRAADIFGVRRWLMAMEARQLKQGFTMEGTNISDVSMTSVGITAAYERRRGEGPMLGIWVGSGELHPPGTLSESKSSKGSQINLGWKWLMEDSLQISAMVSREWRRDGGSGTGDSGGFMHGDSSRSALSRMAVGLQYFTGGQF
jgi:hypothetical protein